MNPVVTIFPDRHGKRFNAVRQMDMSEVERVIRAATPAAEKQELPLLKLARFGDKRADKSGALRYDGNVVEVAGIEGDYDSERMPMADAVECLRKAGVEALFYTSASHTPERPRWRVLCPLATPLSGDVDTLRQQRRHWVGVLNALLGGVLAVESFTLSQSYYFGRIEGRPEPEIVRTDGVCIDGLDGAPQPRFPLNGAEGPKKDADAADGGVGADKSADLYGRVARDVRKGLADYEIIAAHRNHPHAAKQKDPERAVRLVLDKLRAERTTAAQGKDAAPVIIVPPRVPLVWSELHGKEPPEREWVLTYWLPAGHIALLSGKAGVGKTLIAQHMATSIVHGRAFIAGVPKARKVLMWAAEDDADEMWRRQLRISKYFDEPVSALQDRLFIHSYAGADVTLAAPIYGQLMPTVMLAELREQVQDYKAEVVIIDNSARVFGGNENERHSVTTFIAWLQGACAPAAVLLLSHPAKALGSEYSGSTAWEGAVRTRLYMSDRRPDAKPERGEDEANEVADPKERWLSRRKANYSPLDCRRFDLTDDGVLVPDNFLAEQGMETAPTPHQMQDIVRRAVEKLADDMKQHGTASTSSPLFLPKLAKQYGLMERISRKQFASTMFQMLKDKQLVVREVGKYSNRTVKMGVALP